MTGRRFKRAASGQPKKKSATFKLIMIFFGIIAPIALGIVGFTVELNGKPILIAGFERLFGGSAKKDTKMEDEGPTEDQKKEAKKAVEDGQKAYNEKIKDQLGNIETEVAKETYDRVKVLSDYPGLYDKIDDIRVPVARHRTYDSDARDLIDKLDRAQSRLDEAVIKAIKALEELIKNDNSKKVDELKESMSKPAFNKVQAKATHETLSSDINKIHEANDKIRSKLPSAKLYQCTESLFKLTRENREKLAEIKKELDK